MANKPRKMQTFNSGICTIWSTDSDTPTPKYSGLRFEDRVVGYKRHFAAAAVQYVVDRLIRTPSGTHITIHDYVVIGGVQYEIVQVQHIPDTLPPTTDLTLRQLERNIVRAVTDG